jgi:glucosamine-phosphate N-acetyltransferase
MKFEIRGCRKSDFASVMHLLQQLWPSQQLDASRLQTVFERALDSNLQLYLCGTEDDRIVGFVSLSIKNDLWQAANLGHVDELVVDESVRGAGLGTQLLNAIIAEAKGRGCARVELDSAFQRKKAHEFYERNGFENRAYLFSKPLAPG